MELTATRPTFTGSFQVFQNRHFGHRSASVAVARFCLVRVYVSRCSPDLILGLSPSRSQHHPKSFRRAGDPAIDGKDQLLSGSGLSCSTRSCACASLAKFRSAAFRFFASPSSARQRSMRGIIVSPQTDEDYADWLIIKRSNNQWRVTGKSGLPSHRA